jgi:hypothetical protein
MLDAHYNTDKFTPLVFSFLVEGITPQHPEHFEIDAPRIQVLTLPTSTFEYETTLVLPPENPLPHALDRLLALRRLYPISLGLQEFGLVESEPG